jgi:hypothetical protein
MIMYELYDETVGDIVSYHKTIEGALKALSRKIEALAKPLSSDWEPGMDSAGNPIEFALAYKVIGHKLEE